MESSITLTGDSNISVLGFWEQVKRVDPNLSENAAGESDY